MKRSIVTYAILIGLVLLSLPTKAQTKAGQIDIFSGVDFQYRDIKYSRMFDVLLNLTPGVKWNIGNGYMASAQVIVPIINDEYGERYDKVRLNMAVLSKEWDFASINQFVKVSAGFFSRDRYGLDVKWMWPVNPWLAFDAQMGLTGFWSMAVDWENSDMKRFSGLLGARAYLQKWNTEVAVHGGRYIYTDYGIRGDVMRHFKHVTVGVYGLYNWTDGYDIGFNFVVMLPPYKRSSSKVRIRPASNFRHEYCAQATEYTSLMYATDPEENAREGWFDRSKLKWGANTMTPDFKEKGGDE